MLRTAGPDIDLLSPVDRTFALCARRRHWFMGLPGDTGTAWRDLANPKGGATLSSATLAATDRPGGWRHVPTSGSSIACTATVDGGGGAGMTVAKWVRSDSTSGGYHCVWRAPGWGNSSFYRNGSLIGFYNDSDTLVGESAVTVGKWERWLLSASGNGGAGGTIAVYRDGQLVGSASLGSLVFTNFGAATITLGGDAFSQYFQGAIDDVDIYPWSLSDGEAMADYLQSGGQYPDGLRRASIPDAALFSSSSATGFKPWFSQGPQTLGIGVS